jgi:hypothetical protein
MRTSSKTNRSKSQADDDPTLAFLNNAPIDDEPVTEDDRQAIAEALRARQDGTTVPAEEAKRRTLAGERRTASA